MPTAPPTPIVHYHQPGDQVLKRFRRRGPVSYVHPVTVVHDGPEYTSLYLRPGTPTKRRVMPDGSGIPRDMPYAASAQVPFAVGDGTWLHNHVLIVIREGDAYDIELFWTEEDWSFQCWYVNLQDPVRRVPVGFDTADHVLDLVVTPDLAWSWKDEHEMVDALAIDRFSEAEATAIRAAGERVIPDIEARRWPFDESLIDWRPDPAWPVPAMPLNWNDD